MKVCIVSSMLLVLVSVFSYCETIGGLVVDKWGKGIQAITVVCQQRDSIGKKGFFSTGKSGEFSFAVEKGEVYDLYFFVRASDKFLEGFIYGLKATGINRVVKFLTTSDDYKTLSSYEKAIVNYETGKSIDYLVDTNEFAPDEIEAHFRTKVESMDSDYAGFIRRFTNIESPLSPAAAIPYENTELGSDVVKQNLENFRLQFNKKSIEQLKQYSPGGLK